jgi:hypothetical protein
MADYSEEEIDDDGIVLEGWLAKQGGWMKSWTRRWFVISMDQKMTYYTDEDKKTKKGEINLQYVTEVTTASYPDNCIVIIGKKLKRDYHLQTAKGKRKKWMNAIKSISTGAGLQAKRRKKKQSRKSVKVSPVLYASQPPLRPIMQPINVVMRQQSAPVGTVYHTPPVVLHSPSVSYAPVQPMYAAQPMYATQPMYSTAPMMPHQVQPLPLRTVSAPPPPVNPNWDQASLAAPASIAQSRAEGETTAGGSHLPIYGEGESGTRRTY